MSPRNHSVPLAESQHHVIDPTNPRGALDDGVEDRLHVRRRAADDAEHLGRCRLMLQRLAQFRVALAEFLEQPHVLDGDHGLVGEGFKQLDLLVGERTNLRRRIWIAPIGSAFAQQRRDKRSECQRRRLPADYSGNSASASAKMSWICIVSRSIMARPTG